MQLTDARTTTTGQEFQIKVLRGADIPAGTQSKSQRGAARKGGRRDSSELRRLNMRRPVQVARSNLLHSGTPIVNDSPRTRRREYKRNAALVSRCPAF